MGNAARAAWNARQGRHVRAWDLAGGMPWCERMAHLMAVHVLGCVWWCSG